MNKITDLSSNDKKILDSYDISIFKSAVAYLQNSRHSSCQPNFFSEKRSNVVPKYKIKRDTEPPLLPVESRLAVVYKKYSPDVQTVRKKIKQEFKLKVIDIDHSKASGSRNLDIRYYNKLPKDLEFECKNHEGCFGACQGRRNSQGYRFDTKFEENLYNNYREKDLNKYLKKICTKSIENQKLLDDNVEGVETTEVSLQSYEDIDNN
jgi:hypothetical protein